MPKLSDPLDTWYLRLPDGQVMRARDTESVRRHILNGRIPLESVARRSDEEEWRTLEWLTEFSDLVKQRMLRKQTTPPKTNESPQPMADLKTVGVRGVFGELLTAMESTLRTRKLVVAGATMVVAGVVTTAFRPFFFLQQFSTLATLVVAMLLLVLGGFSIALLTQITFVELCRLRRATWKEATATLGRYGTHITMLLTMIAGTAFLITTALRAWPRWIVAEQLYFGSIGPEPLAALAQVVRLVLETMMWALFFLTPLLAPAIVIEDTGPLTTIRRWWGLLRRHGLRVFLYESWVVTLGVVTALPLVLALGVATTGFGNGLPAGAWATLLTLASLAFTPAFAYLVVANVFIFINLRYETPTFADLQPK